MKRIVYRTEDNQALKVTEETAEKLLKSKGFTEAPLKRPYKSVVELSKEAEENLFKKKQKASK